MHVMCSLEDTYAIVSAMTLTDQGTPAGTQRPRELSGQDAHQRTEDKDEQNPKSHLENRWGPGTRMLFPNQMENRKAVQRFEGTERVSNAEGIVTNELHS